jgi:hypothetical protein
MAAAMNFSPGKVEGGGHPGNLLTDLRSNRLGLFILIILEYSVLAITFFFFVSL